MNLVMKSFLRTASSLKVIRLPMIFVWAFIALSSRFLHEKPTSCLKVFSVFWQMIIRNSTMSLIISLLRNGAAESLKLALITGSATSQAYSLSSACVFQISFNKQITIYDNPLSSILIYLSLCSSSISTVFFVTWNSIYLISELLDFTALTWMVLSAWLNRFAHS